jgi:MFS family permease
MNEGGSRGLGQGLWSALRIVADAQVTAADRVLDGAQARVFRFLWLFLPEPAIARDVRFQHLLVSRFLSDAGQQTVAFGALVAVAREGGSALEMALVGTAALLPPTLFGLYGGIVADALPKRTALAGAYAGQALLCLVAPLLLGTGLPAVLALIFCVNTLGQVSAPSESSVLPLVASDEEMATAASLINLAAAAGAGFATALFAPVLVRSAGIEPAFYLAGVLLLLAASRVFDLPTAEPSQRLALPPLDLRLQQALIWLAEHPAVGTMIVISVLAGTVNVVLQTLAPRYVVAVLGADAADTAYVFAPSVLGLVVALVAAPFLMSVRGERVAALFGFLIAGASLFLLGVVGEVARVVDDLNPLRLTEVVGIQTNARVRAAGLLAVPLAFGVSLTATCVQTYINRRMPVKLQGRTFAAQGVLRNGTAIVPLLTLGAAASVFGVEEVLLTSPLVLLVAGYGLFFLSFRFAGLAPPSLRVVGSFWEEPEAMDSG